MVGTSWLRGRKGYLLMPWEITGLVQASLGSGPDHGITGSTFISWTSQASHYAASTC
jgi:hypothetical protein